MPTQNNDHLKTIERILSEIVTPQKSTRIKSTKGEGAFISEQQKYSESLKNQLEEALKGLYKSQPNPSLLNGASTEVKKVMQTKLGIKYEEYSPLEETIRHDSEKELKGKTNNSDLKGIVEEYKQEKSYTPLTLEKILKAAEKNRKSFSSTEALDMNKQNDFIKDLTKIASKFTNEEQFKDMESRLQKSKIGTNMLVMNFIEDMIPKIKNILEIEPTERVTIGNPQTKKKSALSSAIGLLKRAAAAPAKAIQKITGRKKNGNYTQL